MGVMIYNYIYIYDHLVPSVLRECYVEKGKKFNMREFPGCETKCQIYKIWLDEILGVQWCYNL